MYLMFLIPPWSVAVAPRWIYYETVFSSKLSLLLFMMRLFPQIGPGRISNPNLVVWKLVHFEYYSWEIVNQNNKPEMTLFLHASYWFCYSRFIVVSDSSQMYRLQSNHWPPDCTHNWEALANMPVSNQIALIVMQLPAVWVHRSLSVCMATKLCVKATGLQHWTLLRKN